MANISVQREPSTKAQAPLARDLLSPFRTMRELLRWDPFTEMAPLWTDQERGMFAPDFDVKETKEAFIFTADLPGIDAKDVDVALSDNRLTVSGKKEQQKEEKGETYYRSERSYGSFTRSFTLPEGANADKVNAELKNGVLTLNIAKRAEAKPRQIDVKST